MTRTESLVPKLFGTDGVRGLAGRYPLDRETVRRLGAAITRALPRGTAKPRFLIGRDTRQSGVWIEEEFAAGAREKAPSRRAPGSSRRLPWRI